MSISNVRLPEVQFVPLQSTFSTLTEKPAEESSVAPSAGEAAEHRVTLRGTDLSFPCSEDDTILRAALRAGLGHPYECNSGGCGSCLFDLVQGEVVDHWPEAPGLSARSRAKGRRLACQSSPRGDCTIATRMKPHCVPVITPQRRSAVLKGVKLLTHDMGLFTFKTEDAADFKPGQYALLNLPGVEGARAYSMSNLPNADGCWEFIIKRMRGGRGTGVLFDQVEPGDRIVLDGPYGMAYLRTDSPRDIVCIGGGSGLSPLMSILSLAVRKEDAQDQRIHLFYGARTPADACVEQLLEQDPLLSARVHRVTAISDQGPDLWTGERGFIHEIVGRWFAQGHDPMAHDFYFCGPPPMTNAVQHLLLEAKVPVNQVHYDRFL